MDLRVRPARHIETPALSSPALCAIPRYFFYQRIFHLRFIPSLSLSPTDSHVHYTKARATITNDSHSTDLRARSKSYSQTLAHKLDLRFLRHSQPPHELKLSPCANSNILIFTQSRRGGCRSGSGGSSGPGNLSLQLSLHLGQWLECNTRIFLA